MRKYGDTGARSPLVINKGVTGFTLIEIMIVVVIIGVLAGLIVPKIAGNDDKARVSATKSGLKAIESALEMYKLDNFVYPSSEEGLQALVSNPNDLPTYKKGGYLKKVPKDPWNREYIYISPGSTGPYDLLSTGSDGQEGGEDVAADISLSDL